MSDSDRAAHEGDDKEVAMYGCLSPRDGGKVMCFTVLADDTWLWHEPKVAEETRIADDRPRPRRP